MKKSFTYLVSLLVTIVICQLMGGCSTITSIEVYNNTDSTVEFLCDGQNTIVKSGSLFDLPNQVLREGFVIRLGEKSFTFKIPIMDNSISSKLIKHTIKGDLLKLQINSDGLIYIVAPDTKLPASKFPEQPESFPIRPVK